MLRLKLSGKENPGFRCESGGQPSVSPGCVRIDPKGGPGLPLGRKGKLRRSEGCEPGSVARGFRSRPAPSRHPQAPRAPQPPSQVVAHPSRHPQRTQAPPRARISFAFTRSTFPGRRGAGGAWGLPSQGLRTPSEIGLRRPFPGTYRPVILLRGTP